MSYAFDTVQLALSKVRDSGELPEHHRDIIADVQQVIDQWHDVNHELGGALNKAPRSAEAVYLLQMTVEEPDPERRRERQVQYYEGR